MTGAARVDETPALVPDSSPAAERSGIGGRTARHRLISAFVIVWMTLFQYETLRLNYLTPLIHRLWPTTRDRALPKLRFLYPPAGWPMFYNIDRSYGFAEVYGIEHGQPLLIDPHRIFATRFVWYDNIRRNVLISVLSRASAPSFCRYLHRKFPQFEAFAVMYGEYPDVAEHPDQRLYQLAYRCQ